MKIPFFNNHIAEELKDKAPSGKMDLGQARQIMGQKHLISKEVSNKILKELKDSGLIEISKGKVLIKK